MTALYDPTAPLTASGNLRRRRAVSAVASSATILAAVLAVGVLALVVFTVIQRGAGAISWQFLTAAPPQFGGPGGGIAPAIVGTATIVAVAAAMAMPVGVAVAIFLTEYAGGRLTRPIQLAVDVMNSLPSIVIGLFVFGLLVAGRHQSGFAASFALAMIMLPLIARSTQEMLRLVPGTLRDAAEALGVSRWRTIVGVILPSALGGIVTGTVLAIARAAGETAPLLIVCSIYGNKTTFDIFGQAIPNIPVSIFTLSEQADPSGFTKAWGAALVLLTFILLTNIVARTLLARSRRNMTR